MTRWALTFAIAYGVLLPQPFAQASRTVYRMAILIAGDPSSLGASNPMAEELAKLGFIESVNLVTDLRGPAGQGSQLDAMAAEAVRLRPDVIVVGGAQIALAVKKATSTIPIVFTAGDPVGRGLVASLSHPGGNLTGTALFDLEMKRIELLNEVVGRQATIAIIGPPAFGLRQGYLAEVAAVIGGPVDRFRLEVVSDASGYAPAFERIARQRIDAVSIVVTPLATHSVDQLTSLVIKHRMAAIAEGREFAINGGLLAFSIDWSENGRRVAHYVSKILKGAKPADLPVEQTSRFSLVVNLKSAKALGIAVPRSILARADEIIE